MNPGREPVDRFVAEIIFAGMIPPGSKILELGTGKCYDRWMIFHDGYEFIPTDKNPGREGIQYADAENIPKSLFRDMDVIFATELLEHVEFPLRVVENCHEHLKPGGLLVITMPFMYAIHCDDVVKDYQRFTPDGLASLFERAGFARYYAGCRYKEGERENEPSYVVGWARKAERVQQWQPELPESWRDRQLEGERKWKERNPDEKLIW